MDRVRSNPCISRPLLFYGPIALLPLTFSADFLFRLPRRRAVEDTDGDESDGYDESLIPVDFKTSGQIVDDDILKNFIKPMSEGGM